MSETALPLSLHEVSPDDWPETAAHFADFSFEQSLTYGRAAADRIGATLEFFRLEDAAGRMVSCGAVRVKRVPGLGRGIAWMPSGPLIRTANGDVPSKGKIAAVLDALKAHYADNLGHVLRLRLPGLSFAEANMADSAAQRAGYEKSDRAPGYLSCAIDLTMDDEALMKSFSGKWRTDLRYALKSDLSLDVGCDDSLKTRFMTLFDVVQQEKGFAPDITPEFHFDLTGPDYDLKILIAHKDGTDLGGIVVGVTGRSATYLFGATAHPGRKLRSGFFLTWQGLRMARDMGCLWYDMGGIDEEANPDVARFKRRMNGEDICAAGPYEARPSGPVGALIAGLEQIRNRLKGR